MIMPTSHGVVKKRKDFREVMYAKWVLRRQWLVVFQERKGSVEVVIFWNPGQSFGTVFLRQVGNLLWAPVFASV